MENTKTEVSHLHKQKRLLTEDKDRLSKESEALKTKIELREQFINDKDYELKQIKEKHKELDSKLSELRSGM